MRIQNEKFTRQYILDWTLLFQVRMNGLWLPVHRIMNTQITQVLW